MHFNVIFTIKRTTNALNAKNGRGSVRAGHRGAGKEAARQKT